MNMDHKLVEGSMERLLDLFTSISVLGVLAQGLGFAFHMVLCYQRTTV